MGSPYTTITAIAEDHFDAFDEALKSVKTSLTLAAWRSLLEQFYYSPDDFLEELAGEEIVAEGVEPDWFNQSLVSTLRAALVYNCPGFGTSSPGLIEDLWYSRGSLPLTRALHAACLTPEDRLAACLYRLLFLDRNMLGTALANCDAAIPPTLEWRRRWVREFPPGPSRGPDGPDPIDREAASTVTFAYRYPLCLLNSAADESILSPEQVAQFVVAAVPAGLLERFADALPSDAPYERRDILSLIRLLQDLEPPFPYLCSIAYGT